jgi:virulence-associated protein VapD
MYAIAFDLIVEDLKVHYPGPSYNNAYQEIANHLEQFSFYRRQGSVYVTDSPDLANLFGAINTLRTISWFGPSVRDLRAFKIESWSNFTSYVKGHSNSII